MMRLAAALWTVLLASVATGEVKVVLDDFDNLAASPWGYAADTTMTQDRAAHRGRGCARVTLRAGGQQCALVKPIDVPRDMRQLLLWIKGAPGSGISLQPIFKDRQGFCWFAGATSVNHSGWREKSVDVTPSKLKADWRLNWWKGYDKGKLCLLYTSPSPRDLSTSRMPSSA